MGKGKKNKNRPRWDAKLAAKSSTTDTTDTSRDTATAPLSGGGGQSSSTPTIETTVDPENKTATSKIPNCHFVPRWILKNFGWQEG
jgi:hypothetical protein